MFSKNSEIHSIWERLVHLHSFKIYSFKTWMENIRLSVLLIYHDSPLVRLSKDQDKSIQMNQNIEKRICKCCSTMKTKSREGNTSNQGLKGDH